MNEKKFIETSPQEKIRVLLRREAAADCWYVGIKS